MTEEVKDETVEETPEVTEEVAEVATEPVAEEVTEEELDAKIEEAAEKQADNLMKKLSEKFAAQKKNADVENKKAAMVGSGIEVNSIQHKIYTTMKGVEVTASLEEAKHINQWFKNFVLFKKSGSPDAYNEMKREFAICEKMAMHQKLEPINTVNGADGGFWVPTIMYNKIVPFLEDLAKIKANSYVIDATGIKTLDVPQIGSGAYVNWNAETAQKTTTSMVFAHQTLTPYILAGIMVITQQMLDDAPFPMLQIVAQELARAIAKAEDAAFASGSGTGQPTGIDTYTPVYTVSAGAALAYNHFLSAFWGMPQAYRESSGLRWIMHRNNIMLTAGLADTTGRPIFDVTNPMSNILGTPRQPHVLGVPVIENNDISEKTIYLVDLQYYWIAQARGLSIDVATEATIGGTIDMSKGAGYYVAGHNLWERNEIAIRAEEKIDGELVTTRALTTITATRP
jgi:HK97 family phage major capsid protein